MMTTRKICVQRVPGSGYACVCVCGVFVCVYDEEEFGMQTFLGRYTLYVCLWVCVSVCE